MDFAGAVGRIGAGKRQRPLFDPQDGAGRIGGREALRRHGKLPGATFGERSGGRGEGGHFERTARAEAGGAGRVQRVDLPAFARAEAPAVADRERRAGRKLDGVRDRKRLAADVNPAAVDRQSGHFVRRFDGHDVRIVLVEDGFMGCGRIGRAVGQPASSIAPVAGGRVVPDEVLELDLEGRRSEEHVVAAITFYVGAGNGKKTLTGDRYIEQDRVLVERIGPLFKFSVQQYRSFHW